MSLTRLKSLLLKLTPPEPVNLSFDIDNDVFDPVHANLNLELETDILSTYSTQHNLNKNEILNLILNNQSNQTTLQIKLVDFLGFDHLDFITELLNNQTSVLNSKSAKHLRHKQLNKQKAKQLNENLKFIKTDPDFPHVYRLHPSKTALELVNPKRTLPEGTQRFNEVNFDKVVIPAQRNTGKFDVELLEIDNLDDNIKTTFSNYSNFNKMQTLTFDVVYNTNENMLICAPTGAGKTDVAVLACLGKFKFNLETKIVYVAPLKALAAEITLKLSQKLGWMGVQVRELTGDMQLTKSEIERTHILVTTPEKYDVVTRKPNDDSLVSQQVSLLIIDEVHLLHEERGAVIESLIARTRRMVESQQRPIRLIGLSATLPNFVDVAEFLGVNLKIGLFYFDQSFRPVPLEQQFVGVRTKVKSKEKQLLDDVCYDECVKQLKNNFSVMVFVHSRRDTVKTAEFLKQRAIMESTSDLFKSDQISKFKNELRNFKNDQFAELYSSGFATHHAGMSRAERNMSEKLFAQGAVKVLVSTATLAWGVNLPAAVVIIKGTDVYNAQHGGFVDLGISDVIQIFGRAGRPQFEQTGTGILLTKIDKLDHYIDAITNQYPIESRFARRLPENLNAEVALGTVSNIREGISWLGYTYMYVRMRRAPLSYGLTMQDLQDDPYLVLKRRELILKAIKSLRSSQMLVFDENDETESIVEKDIGRIASEFYLLQSTVDQFNQVAGLNTTEMKFITLLSKGEDFSGLKTRKEEEKEMQLVNERVPFGMHLDDPHAKVALLLQAYISRIVIKETALNSDMAYVAQNSARILRAFFLLCISRGFGDAAYAALLLDRSLSRRMWPEEKHYVFQIEEAPADIVRKLTNSRYKILDLKTLTIKELGDLVHNHNYAPKLAKLIERFPLPVILKAKASPLTARVIRLSISAILMMPFRWDTKVHNANLHFWLLVHGHTQLLHVEKMILNFQTYKDTQVFEFAIPYHKDQKQVEVQLVSDSFLGAETSVTVDLSMLELPTTQSIRTNLLRLRPLSVHAFKNKTLIEYYSKKFQYFNPMQSMVFHSLYHHTEPVLLGSPTGSGKTIACEIAVFAALRDRPNAKVVYIAPMKALVKERVHDWKTGICQVPFLKGNKKPKLVEMTGDTQPTINEIKSASLIITTPEKFDGVSRHQSWALSDVALIVMDEVHLLASDRGAILEVIVSRMNQQENKVRLLGMSTAVANAGDLASWLGIKSNIGLFNFPSSVRPVPLEMFIDGFPDVQGGFCPFMKSMNKPAYLAIRRHAPSKPALVFVPSRRQTRLTAMDLISLSAGDEQSGKWLHMNEFELDSVLRKVKDETLKHTLQYGIAIHHAGLEYSDREISHQLFSSGKVQVLVATSTLAWGVNLPAYLVVVKGTQFFDAKINKYKDMDLTDVLQMMGRAGRPAFDSSGVAVVFTKQSTKQFYKYFLNLGFPVESSLHKKNVLENHLGAEISAQRVTSLEQALDFITHTFLFKRVHSNPSYYIDNKEESEIDEEVRVNKWVVNRVKTAFEELIKSSCLTKQSTDYHLIHTPFLSITSFYYISHTTMRMFLELVPLADNPFVVLKCLALASEYDELAIRHNEDLLNTELSQQIEFKGELLNIRMVDPHVKAFVLVQARMHRLEMPVEDYVQDTITVLDQAIRILQALIDTAAQLNLLNVVFTIIKVLRCIKQGVPTSSNMNDILPGVRNSQIPLSKVNKQDATVLKVSKSNLQRFERAVEMLPRIKINSQVAEIEPIKQVYCPMFHKPQRESWFVIRILNGVMSVERVQRKFNVQLNECDVVYIMNDTVDIDYELR